ncbi:UNVERIFIED_CONTAM: hypothetical protein K2H54_019379 [Gekko kuhli]
MRCRKAKAQFPKRQVQKDEGGASQGLMGQNLESGRTGSLINGNGRGRKLARLQSGVGESLPFGVKKPKRPASQRNPGAPAGQGLSLSEASRLLRGWAEQGRRLPPPRAPLVGRGQPRAGRARLAGTWHGSGGRRLEEGRPGRKFPFPGGPEAAACCAAMRGGPEEGGRRRRLGRAGAEKWGRLFLAPARGRDLGRASAAALAAAAAAAPSAPGCSELGSPPLRTPRQGRGHLSGAGGAPRRSAFPHRRERHEAALGARRAARLLRSRRARGEEGAREGPRSPRHGKARMNGINQEHC